jgi:stage V sporulation protein SpoVS
VPVPMVSRVSHSVATQVGGAGVHERSRHAHISITGFSAVTRHGLWLCCYALLVLYPFAHQLLSSSWVHRVRQIVCHRTRFDVTAHLMPQLCFNGSRTDPQLVAARGFARTSPHATRRLYIKVRADQQDAGTPPQPQQPPTSQPKRLLSPPSRQARQAVAQPPSSIPRIRWRQGQQKGPSLTPQQPDASKPTTPATPQQLATPAHPGKHPPDDAAQVEQQQQQMDAGAMPPAEGPAERSTPAAPSKAGVAALQPPNAPLPEPQPYLQQQQQVYTRTEQQQHTQRRQELEVQLQQQQQQQRLQEHTAGSAAGPGHKGGAKQQADSRVAPPDGSESYSATSSSSSSSSGGSREKVISVAPQHRRPPPQPSSFTPIHQVSKHTTVHALGGALAAESALSPHQLLLAWGPEAVNIAVKGCATARRKLQEAGGSAHQTVVTRGRHRSDSAAAAGGEQQQGWDLLVQPTLRGHGVGTAAVALDVIRIPQGAGETVCSVGLSLSVPLLGCC